LAFAAAAALLLVSAATPRCAEPIRIGAMNAVSGPLGVIGLDAINGFSQYLEETGNKMAGRDVVLLKEDDAGIPAQGMERVRRLVEREHVQLLTGITSSAVAYAIRDYVNAHHVPLIVMGSAGANDITDKLAGPYSSALVSRTVSLPDRSGPTPARIWAIGRWWRWRATS
jgi:branched-chain amino acid transport system substrate-binding protein